jgi:hypothetical protein
MPMHLHTSFQYHATRKNVLELNWKLRWWDADDAFVGTAPCCNDVRKNKSLLQFMSSISWLN